MYLMIGTFVVGIPLTWLFIRYRRLHPIEKLGQWLVAITLHKITFNIIVMNLEWVQRSGRWLDFITTSTTDYLNYSVFMAFVSSMLVACRVSLLSAVGWIAISALLLAEALQLYEHYGMIRFVKWELSTSFIYFFFQILMIYAFGTWFRKRMQKEGWLSDSLFAQKFQR
ncbi:hypothetical protein ACFQZT_14300 [Paenibacillus sp. GCM10027628]|uniref:hypothetical protein n=1 Tax=Paenibacillus sp. GCM10027628 TaxID=3273413 RepID=UPI00363CAF7D